MRSASRAQDWRGDNGGENNVIKTPPGLVRVYVVPDALYRKVYPTGPGWVRMGDDIEGVELGWRSAWKSKFRGGFKRCDDISSFKG